MPRRLADRDRVLGQVNRWLTAAVMSGDLVPLCAADVSRVLRRLDSRVEELRADLKLAYATGWLHWMRATARRGSADGKTDFDAALEWFELVAKVEPETLPAWVALFFEVSGALEGGERELSPDSGDLVEHALASGDDDDLDEAISAIREIVASLPAGHPDLPGHQTNLGIVLQDRFERGGALGDIDEAIDVSGTALAALPGDDPDRVMYLTNLGAAFLARARQTGEPADLADAMEFLEQAAAVSPPGHPALANCLSNLGVVHLDWFGLEASPHDLDAAVRNAERAVALTPENHGEDLAIRLQGLASAFDARFRQGGSPADLGAVIDALERRLAVLPPGHPGRPLCLTALGMMFRDRYELAGLPEDLDAAVRAGERAAAGAGDHPERAQILAHLGESLRMRFEYRGSRADLDEAIRVGIQALQADPAGPDPLASLSASLRMRCGQTGDVADLDTAIDLASRAVAGLSPGVDWAIALKGLAAALRARFERTGELADLDAAIRACHQAATAVPDGSPERGDVLSALAAAAHTRFTRTGSQADLDTAIAAGRSAVDALPAGHADRSRSLSNLAAASLERFGSGGEAADLDAAVAAAELAVTGIADGHSGLAGCLSNLALVLKARFEHTGQPADLDAAMSAMKRAVDAAPAGHPVQAGLLSSLAGLLLLRYERAGDAADLADAAEAGRRGADAVSSLPVHRLKAAMTWAQASAGAGRWPDAVAGWTAVIELLGYVAPRSLGRRDQEGVLAGLPGLGTAAAACCLQAGLPGRAVELSEQGRGILLGYALDSRADLADLTAADPELSERFAVLRDALGQADGPSRPDAGGESGHAGGLVPGGVAGRAREKAAAFDAVLREIRGRPGFGRFLAPLTVGELRQAATDGPVVLVNAAAERSDALIVTAGADPEPLTLPGLTPDSLIGQARSFFEAVMGWQDSATPAGPEAEERLLAVLGWLWDTITAPVLDRLGITGPPPAGPDGQAAWPRIWWCPSGVLSFLPLHASGHHEAGGSDSALDRVISSYTPTLRALLQARRPRRGAPPGAGSLVAVAMSQTPGLDSRHDLPAVAAETQMLGELFPDSLTCLSGGAARHRDVVAALSRARWAHFACHARADLQAPSASQLMLADWSSEPLTVADIARLRLRHAELAFLSACSTARGGLTVPDEAIHLGSAFQLAGFRHVIATLWPVADSSAAVIARAAYTRLRSDGSADHAARALHHATRSLRRHAPASPTQWATHVHSGA